MTPNKYLDADSVCVCLCACECECGHICNYAHALEDIETHGNIHMQMLPVSEDKSALQ